MGGSSGGDASVVDNSIVGGGHHSYQQQMQQHQQQQVPTPQHLGNPMGQQMGSQQQATKVDGSLDNSGYGLIPPHSRVLNEVPSMYSQMVGNVWIFVNIKCLKLTHFLFCFLFSTAILCIR